MKINIKAEALNALKSFSVPEKLEFGKCLAPVMVQAIYKNGAWGELNLVPYGTLDLDPCAKVLHYGQEIFEGMKAYKNAKGEVNLFRPLENFKRFNFSARRMAMPEVTQDYFIDGIETLVRHCKEFIPTEIGHSLYMRPMMIATEVGLGIKPAEEFMFLIVASPSGSYFKQENVKVFIERNFTRAAPGGMGSAKTGGNYAGSLIADKINREKGFHQTMWLDAVSRTYVEEMSGMNFFAVVKGELYTPPLSNTILAGITRDSVLILAREMGIKTHEEKINVNTLRSQIRFGECTEAFICGTAAIITPIESLTDGNEVYNLRDATGLVANQLRSQMLAIQNQNIQGPSGWIHKIDC
ncbi:MAG: branched-chain amino acid aminotransferase [Bacteriovoracaceae bacterium]